VDGGGMMAYAMLRTANTSGLHPNLRGIRRLRGLGMLGQTASLTAQAAMQQAITAYAGAHLNPKDFGDQSWLTEAENQISAGQFNVGWYSPSCGTAPSNVNLFQTASGLALGTSSAGIGILASTSVIAASTAAIAGAVTMGIGAIFAVIELIFAHHAAAVKRDLSFGCAALPAVNNSFSLIAQAVQGGQMTPATAQAALLQVYETFMQQGGASGTASGPGSIPSGGTSINDSPYCNSNCEMSVILYAMVLYWQAQYAAIAEQQAAEAQQAAAASSGTTPAPGNSVIAPGVPGSGLASVPPLAWVALAIIGALAVL
jgi:hypothetical protein